MSFTALLVDDDLMVLQTIRSVFEKREFVVSTAVSAAQALSVLERQSFDLVVTDMRMESDAAGAEVIAAARSASYHPAIALLTAYPLAEEDWQALGAHKMLVKPMHTQILLQQIEKLLSSHEAKLRLTSVPPPTAMASGKLTKVPAPRTSKPSVKTPIGKRGAAKSVVLKSRAKKPPKKLTAKPAVKGAKPYSARS